MVRQAEAPTCLSLHFLFQFSLKPSERVSTRVMNCSVPNVQTLYVIMSLFVPLFSELRVQKTARPVCKFGFSVAVLLINASRYSAYSLGIVRLHPQNITRLLYPAHK